MKSITKVIALSLVLFLSLNLAVAQKGQGPQDRMQTPEARAEKQTQRLAEHLSLTKAQTTKVAAINLKYAQKMEAMKEEKPQDGAGKEVHKALMTQKEAEIKAVLTPEQVTKFESKKAEHGDKKGKGEHAKKGQASKKGGHHKAKNPEESADRQTKKMTENLALTDAQATQVAKINLDFAHKMKALKDQNTEKGANKEAFKTLKNEHQAALKAVLNKEQVAKMEAMHQDKKDKKGHGKHMEQE